VDLKVLFNGDIEKKVETGQMGANETVETLLQDKISTSVSILLEERQRITTRVAGWVPHRHKTQPDRLREIDRFEGVFFKFFIPGFVEADRKWRRGSFSLC